MSFQKNLRNAFENVAPYITNLDTISLLVHQLNEERISLRVSVTKLEMIMKDADITLRTDIQILINELKHFLRIEKRKSDT